MFGSRLEIASATIAVAALLASHQTNASPASQQRSRALSGMDDPPASDLYQYLGCFMDSKTDRVLDHSNKLDSEEMTTELCFDHCSDKGALFMATQFAYECWCSEELELDYERHGVEADCDHPCMGDESETCGGYDAFDLFLITPEQTIEECSGDMVEAYEECESTACCQEGYECVGLGANQCYWQCRPSMTMTTTPSPVVPVAPTPGPVAPVAPTPEPVAPVAPTPEPVAPVAPTPEPVAPVAPPTPEPVAPVTPPTPSSDCKVIIIEGESLALTGDWTKKSDSSASGGQYIVWEGLGDEQNNQSPDDGDIISTTIQVPSAGTYSFQWLMRQPSGVESDKANDSWLYFPDADRFGPAGTSNNYGTFIKVFGRALDGEFKYSGTAEEANHNKNQIAVEFGEAGPYTMEIAGRSHGHEIDQIILFGDDLNVNDAAAGC